MMENEQAEIKKELLGELGKNVEARILTGQEIMKPAEVSLVKELFVERGINLEGIKEKGDLSKQANRVLEAFGGDMEKMSEVVTRLVLAMARLDGGEVTMDTQRPIDEELLGEYVGEYLKNSIVDGEFDFPLNANLSKRVTDDTFFDKYNASNLNVQKVGFRVEVGVSFLNRFMYMCGGEDVSVSERVNSEYIVKSLHGLGNRVLRGYERAGREADIKVNLGDYGEPEKRKTVRHIPLGGVAAMLKSLV